MNLRVREADVRKEQAALVDVLTRELDGWTDPRKFDWLFLDNPFGDARCWVLVEEDDTIVGVSAALPRMLRAGKRTLPAWVLGDFCVTRKLRSLGPAIQLQRAALHAVKRGDVELCYDFPSRSMMAVYQRIGGTLRGELVRMVHLLKTDRAVGRRIHNPVLAKGLSAVGNTALATRAALTKRNANIELSHQATKFDVSPPVGFGAEEGVTVSRTSEYLNWRYLRNPSGAVSCRRVSGGGEGYVVFRATANDVDIVDVFGVDGVSSLRELILGVVDEARERGAASVTAALSSEHPWMTVLGEVGFRKRESSPFVVYAPGRCVNENARWALTTGDRDLY